MGWNQVTYPSIETKASLPYVTILKVGGLINSTGSLEGYPQPNLPTRYLLYVLVHTMYNIMK